MKFKLKFLNTLCFAFAAGIPFFDSSKSAVTGWGNLHQITVLVLAVYLIHWHRLCEI